MVHLYVEVCVCVEQPHLNLSDPSAGPVLVAMVTAPLSVLRGCEGCVHMLFSPQHMFRISINYILEAFN